MSAAISSSGKFGSGEFMITEGSVFELLRRNPRMHFDPFIAHAALIYEETSREVLARTHQRYFAIAAESGFPMIAFADTWRASGSRVAASRWNAQKVNRNNVEFLRSLIAVAEADLVLGALTGPAGDAYRPAEALTTDDALRYHEAQISELAEAHPDLIVAATLPSLPEAVGIARLLSESETPWMVSFVVRPSGVLLDGTPLDQAIDTIDSSVEVAPAGYSINCVHPDIARQALAGLPPHSRDRIVLFQGNASARTPEELDTLTDLESSDAEAFAQSILALMRASSVRAVGGCCGTDESHIKALARLLRQEERDESGRQALS